MAFPPSDVGAPLHKGENEAIRDSPRGRKVAQVNADLVFFERQIE